jgi:hypothetical protein
MNRVDIDQELMGAPASSIVALGQMRMSFSLKHSFQGRWDALQIFSPLHSFLIGAENRMRSFHIFNPR